MLEFIENLFDYIDPAVAYLVLFVSAILENIIPPIPGDTVVIVGAYLVSIEKLNFWGVYISTLFGSVIGFMIMYTIGIKFGRSFFYKNARSKMFKERHIKKVELWFAKWGYWVIFANRFLSGTRSVISVFAGLVHLNGLIVALLALLSAMIWNGLLISIGMLLGHNWEVLAFYVTRYNHIFILFTIVLLVIVLLWRYKKRKKTE